MVNVSMMWLEMVKLREVSLDNLDEMLNISCVISETNERRNVKEKKALKLRLICVHLHLR